MPGVCRVMIDTHFNPADACGCVACAHVVLGHAVTGSSDIFANGYGVLRGEGTDVGIHAQCCGPNTWSTMRGSPNVFVNGKPLVRDGDANVCCGGGSPRMISGSDNVISN